MDVILLSFPSVLFVVIRAISFPSLYFLSAVCQSVEHMCLLCLREYPGVSLSLQGVTLSATFQYVLVEGFVCFWTDHLQDRQVFPLRSTD